MHIVILRNARAAASALARTVASALRVQPDLVLGLPTGQTPILFYRELAALYRRGRADFRRATTFNLDEFVGVPAADPRSYASFMRRHLFKHVNLAPERTHLLDGTRRDWQGEATRYESAIAEAGGLDLVILGLGRNGHIGFNEPAATLQARSHLVRLHPVTRRANAKLAGGRWQRVPERALSMGIATILQGRSVVLLATGAAKASIVRRALLGPVTTRVPASLLQLHPNVIVVLDRAAARSLPAVTSA